MRKISPGPTAPPFFTRPRRKITALWYSWWSMMMYYWIDVWLYEYLFHCHHHQYHLDLFHRDKEGEGHIINDHDYNGPQPQNHHHHHNQNHHQHYHHCRNVLTWTCFTVTKRERGNVQIINNLVEHLNYFLGYCRFFYMSSCWSAYVCIISTRFYLFALTWQVWW